MAGLKRIAPAFPVRDVRVALAYYQRLGFTTREYTGTVGWISEPTVVYGFAVVDDVEMREADEADDEEPEQPGAGELQQTRLRADRYAWRRRSSGHCSDPFALHPRALRVVRAGGRSPGLRLDARIRLPEASCFSGIWDELAAYSCGGSHGFGSIDPHRIPSWLPYGNHRPSIHSQNSGRRKPKFGNGSV